MLHYAYPTLGIYLEHMNRYSSEIAQLLAAKGRTSRSLARIPLEHYSQPRCDLYL